MYEPFQRGESAEWDSSGSEGFKQWGFHREGGKGTLSDSIRVRFEMKTSVHPTPCRVSSFRRQSPNDWALLNFVPRLVKIDGRLLPVLQSHFNRFHSLRLRSTMLHPLWSSTGRNDFCCRTASGAAIFSIKTCFGVLKKYQVDIYVSFLFSP